MSEIVGFKMQMKCTSLKGNKLKTMSQIKHNYTDLLFLEFHKFNNPGSLLISGKRNAFSSQVMPVFPSSEIKLGG